MTDHDRVPAAEARGDGSASLELRAAQDAAAVSRRGVLWRAGLATAAGVGVLSALDAQRADAATNGNFILGQGNDAGTTTSLAPTAMTNSTPLFQVNGSALSATSTTMEINGPGGGLGLYATGASTATTVGLAINGSGSGTANGIYASSSGSGTGLTASSSSGTGVHASSSSGVGLSASSSTNTAVSASSSSGTGVDAASSSGIGVKATSTSGTALSVSGRVHFSRSGAASVAQGGKTKVVTVSGMTSSSLVLVTLQTTAAGIYLAGATPGSGKFTVRLNKAAPTAMKFAWFVLN